jgi:hypothetical protein
MGALKRGVLPPVTDPTGERQPQRADRFLCARRGHYWKRRGMRQKGRPCGDSPGGLFLLFAVDPVAPLDSGCEAVEDRRASDREEKPMDDVAILRRVEHTIQQCRDFNMEFDARTVAEIMTDEDTVAEKYEPLSAERALAFVEYENAAARALGRLRVDRRSA